MWSEALGGAFVWTKASKWRRTAKCKSLIKKVQLQLNIQKNRKYTIIRQSRADIAQLLQNGHLQQASTRVKKLYKDKCLLAAYEQIDQFCCLIMDNLSHVCKLRNLQELSIGVGEAVASLVYAASRCGDLPELQLMRSLFKERFGYEFEILNVELRPGNLVNFELIENLCLNSIPDREKHILIRDIANEYSLPVENNFTKQHQNAICGDNNRVGIQASKYETARKNGLNCSFSDGDLLVTGPDFSSHSKKNAAHTEYREASSARTFPHGMPKTPENSIILEKKSVNQDYRNNLDSKDKNTTSRTFSMTNLTVKSLYDKMVLPKNQYRRLSMSDSVSKNHCKVSSKGCHSFNRLISELKTEEESSSCCSHVHPKLPEYDDVVAKLKDLKAENRQCASFSYLLAPPRRI